MGVPFSELRAVEDKSLPLEGKPPSFDDNLIIHGDNLVAIKTSI
ncbi:DNA methylase family protein [Alteromonas macleodii]|uniref:DNA methylase family protein n=1 Tax=Alteromonas macleodii TaxID=28108 RepID=A0AB36FL59_ALTMA|nr:DNA methylase family protein [Alteromonas macleodii]OES25266.1 DNA methylase family protein [Alteromonas macleodii]OES25903.1 DNA methylase family protein [Alteromonas macleodii]OES38767.1 DNA methylase family protein [Alteromonas macleodii]